MYALIGWAAEHLGNSVWLAFLVAMIAAMLTGLSDACVGSRYARAGGAADVTQRALDRPWLSSIVGVAVMMSGLTSMATDSQAIAENLEKAIGIVLPIKLAAIGLVLLIGCIIYRGIRESMWANIICTLIEAAGLLFIIAIGMKYWGSVKQLAESTVLLLLAVFTVVNASLVVLKLRNRDERGGFEVPIVVPVLGALVCATLIITRLNTALTSRNPAERPAPVIAIAIILIGLALYKVLKPKDVLVKPED